MTVPAPSMQRVKNALLIAAVLLPTVGVLCLQQASTEGMSWLFYVGTVCSIVGAGAAIVLRENSKKPAEPVDVAEPVPEE